MQHQIQNAIPDRSLTQGERSIESGWNDPESGAVTQFIIYPEQVDDTTPVGGKARSLAALSEFPVPSWFVLLPDAFVRDGDAPPVLCPAAQAELDQALAQLAPQGEPVAVRSSAREEDGLERSFAGQFDSFLNVPLHEVTEKAIAVWQSGYSDRVQAYQGNHPSKTPIDPSIESLDYSLNAPAVLIQRMVQAEAAGVAFSANPVTGQRGIAVISAVSGLGDRLVAGEAEGETYQVDRTGQITERHWLAKTPVLSDEQIRSIATLVRHVEQHFHRPQDIEWAIEQGQVYLLQARSITTLAKQVDPDGEVNVWDNSNIAESYGGVTTPLTFSFARRAYAAVYREFCRLMGVDEATIAQQDATFHNLLGLIQGRIYYNLLNWYRILALLPGFTINRRFMEQMMGVKEELPADVIAELDRANWQQRFQDGFKLGRTILGLIKNGITLPRQIQRFYQRLDRALGQPVALETMRADELVRYYQQLEQQLLTRWDAPLVNDFFAMIFYGVLRQLTVKWCNDTDGTLQNALIVGEGGMISAEPIHRIQRMAAIVRTQPAWIIRLTQGTLQDIRSQLPSFPALQTEYTDYLTQFADRCLEELKLESATLEDDPLPLLRSIGQLAARAPVPEVDQPAIRQQAEQQVQQMLRSRPLHRWLFNWVLSHARARVRDRENLRFERTRVFGRVRRITVELGKRFYAQNLLNSPQDIFYLELHEILGLIDGTATCTNCQGLVAVRQAEFTDYLQRPAPADRFTTHGMVHPLTPQLQFTNDSPKLSECTIKSSPHSSLQDVPVNSLQGIGCCPGIVRAPVQIITNPKQAILQPGHILIAERTDPGWVLIFPAAAGLLVERGSLLSHAAIVAREMGIPAIVAIPHLTRSLQTGDWVEMNGTTGQIHPIPPEDISVL